MSMRVSVSQIVGSSKDSSVWMALKNSEKKRASESARGRVDEEGGEEEEGNENWENLGWFRSGCWPRNKFSFHGKQNLDREASVVASWAGVAAFSASGKSQ